MMTAKQAVPIIRRCAQLYEANLAETSILFVSEENGTLCSCEAEFNRHNFMHLTGVDCNLNPGEFYYRALRNALKPSAFRMKQDQTTEQKLSILAELMQFHNKACIIGEYDGSRMNLQTDVLAGTVRSVLGFIKTQRLYVPNTALKEDIRNITKKAYPVVAIFKKPRLAKTYGAPSFVNHKRVSLDALRSALSEKVDF
ncbi:MAG: PBECR4 domain-containing protein [Oscillospiraceae bacterium]|nr:PBECR4 domain-containing protein [Oscillospiraceae bacterium]